MRCCCAGHDIIARDTALKAAATRDRRRRERMPSTFADIACASGKTFSERCAAAAALLSFVIYAKCKDAHGRARFFSSKRRVPQAGLYPRCRRGFMLLSLLPMLTAQHRFSDSEG